MPASTTGHGELIVGQDVGALLGITQVRQLACT